MQSPTQKKININAIPGLQKQACCTPTCGGRGSKHNGSISRLRRKSHATTQEVEELSELVAVIVSIRHEGSYDELFTMVEQKSEPGTHVNTYLIEDVDPDKLLKLCSINFDE